MLLIVHADNTVTTIAENLNIGDTAADIYVISPFPSTQSCSLLYRLPSGEEGEPTFAQGTALGGDYEGAVYSFEIPSAFTKEVGSVRVMVSLVDTKGRRFVSDEVTFDVGGFVTLPFPDSEEQGTDFAAQLEAIALSVTKLMTAYENIRGVVNIIPSDQTDSVDISVTLDGPQTGIVFTFNLTQANMQSIAEGLISAHNADEEAHPFILGEIGTLKSEIGSTENIMKMLEGGSFANYTPPTDAQIGDTWLQGDILWVYANTYETPTSTSPTPHWVRSNRSVFLAYKSQIDSQAVSIGINGKRLTNLEQGVPADQFVIDDSVAYVKDVPTNACQYAMVSELDESVTALEVRGTNCFLCNSLADGQTKLGVTVTTLDDGKIEVNGQNNTADSTDPNNPPAEAQFDVCTSFMYLTAGYYRCAGLTDGVYVLVYNSAEGRYHSILSTSRAVRIEEGMYRLQFRVSASNDTNYNNEIFPIMVYKVASSTDADKEFVPYKLTEFSTSDIATDNYIEVEGGGIITFENPTSAPVASTIVYQLRGG